MVSPTLIAYHGNPAIKSDILAVLAAHREADELIKGKYWEDGKGCAVGCTINSGNHIEYEARFGIPVMLAHLEDSIFEGLPNDKAKEWPERFMGAISPGADLSRVGWLFLHRLLTDAEINPGINHELVRDAVKQCADVLVPLSKGLPADERAARAAERAARAAESAARAAESAAAWRAAESVARAAESAAESAESAAESAAPWSTAAWSAAWSAAAWSAAESAESAAPWSTAAWSAAWIKMSDLLVSLLRDAPASLHTA